MDPSAYGEPAFEAAHPLAVRLIEDLRRARVSGPVLEVGSGHGRNTRALVAAGLEVLSTDDAAQYTQLPARRGSIVAALSTHAYLHGTAPKLRAGIAELARVLRPGAPAYLTLGSTEDVNYGFGAQIDEYTFAPGDGPEAGIPHVYLDRDAVIEFLRGFTIETLELVDVDRIVGRWAHGEDELPGKRHWFVKALRANRS
jgi:hypothetical protein